MRLGLARKSASCDIRKSAVFAICLCLFFALSLSSCENAPHGIAPDSASSEKSAVVDEKTLLKTLSEAQATLPASSPKLEAPLEKVISFYEVGHRYDLAEKYLHQLTMCKESNWNWERLALSLSEQKKFDEAIEAMKKSVAMVESKNKADNTAAVYIRYAKLLEKAGRASEAAPYREKAHTLAPNVKNSTVRWH